MPWPSLTGQGHRNFQNRSVGGRGEGSSWRKMRQAGDRSRCETEATVHRGNWAEPEAPREEADPRRPRGFYKCNPQDGAYAGQRAHRNIDDQVGSIFVRFGSVTWGSWKLAGSSKHLTPGARVFRYHTWWSCSKAGPLPDPPKHFPHQTPSCLSRLGLKMTLLR